MGHQPFESACPVTCGVIRCSDRHALAVTMSCKTLTAVQWRMLHYHYSVDVQRQNIQGILSVYRTLLGGVLEKRYTVQYVLALASGSGSSGAVPDSSGGTSALPVPSVVGLTAVNDTSNITHNSGTDGGSLASGSSITETESAEAFSKKALSQQQHQLMEERQQQQQNISQVVRLLQKESLLKACCWCSIEG